jgi:hypothetical protein
MENSPEKEVSDALLLAIYSIQQALPTPIFAK